MSIVEIHSDCPNCGGEVSHVYREPSPHEYKQFPEIIKKGWLCEKCKGGESSDFETCFQLPPGLVKRLDEHIKASFDAIDRWEKRKEKIRGAWHGITRTSDGKLRLFRHKEDVCEFGEKHVNGEPCRWCDNSEGGY